MTGAGIPVALGDDEVSVLLPPQAASSEPAAVIENPKTDARTSNWRLLILPLRTCSTRWWPYSLSYFALAISLLPLMLSYGTTPILAMALVQGRPRLCRVTIHTRAADGKKELTSQLVATPSLNVQIFFTAGV
jgi:hypothetical protein